MEGFEDTRSVQPPAPPAVRRAAGNLLPAPARTRRRRHIPLTAGRIAALYAVAASVWIIFSDRLVSGLGPGPFSGQLQTLKGLLYVGLTAWALFALIRKSQSDLQAAERELRAVIESMADAVLIVDREGRIVGANYAAMRLFDLLESRASGLHVSALEPMLSRPDDSPLEPEENPLLTALSGSASIGLELKIRRSDDPVHVSLNAAPVWRGREVALAVAVLRDVTEVRRLHRLRDEFLSTAAHELKTPVAAIKGYVQLLQRWAPEGHEPREKAAFVVLDRQSSRLSRLVEELLAVSRLQLGRMQMRRQRLDLGELTVDVSERMQALSARHQLTVTREPGLLVDADRDRLEQVLVNLLDNAVKFSPEGGEVRLRAVAVGEEALVTVQDFGVGIPADRRSEIFKPFYQAHAGTDYHYQGGIGIGLHISQEIVGRHGGRMWFDSEEGRGSTFCFALPLAQRERDEREAQDGAGGR